MFLFENFRVCSAEEVNFDFYFSQKMKISHEIKRILFERKDNAKTLVVEENYLDIDHSSAFFMQHTRAFTPQDRRTTRIHIFSEPLTKDQLESLSKENIDLIKNSYLGFIVLRPTTNTSIGRTFLKPPNGIKASCLTKVSIKVNLFGINLSVEACPYISQDSLVMACATSSLWMSNFSLAKRFDLALYTTSEITALALSLDRPYGPTLGGRGLRVDEQERALTMLGYDTQLWEIPDTDKLIEICYICTTSGIPPILNLYFPKQPNFKEGGLHTFCVVGNLKESSPIKSIPLSEKTNIFCASDFVSGLIVNDDRHGIYLPVNFEKITDSDKDNLYNCRTKVKFKTKDGEIFGYCHALLVPFPPRVWKSITSALEDALYYLNFFIHKNKLPNEKLIINPILMSSNDYKDFLIKNKNVIPAQIVNLYRSLSMPRFIWVIEYSSQNIWDIPGQKMIQGEIILDATLPSSDHGFSWFCIHIPNVIRYKCFRDKSFRVGYEVIPTHSPYPSCRT